MKIRVCVMVTILVLLTAVTFTGCSESDRNGRSDDKKEERDSSHSSDDENDSNAGGLIGNHLNNNDSDIERSDEWPDMVNLPEFTYGDIASVTHTTDTYDGVMYDEYTIEYENVEEGSAYKYAKEIDDIDMHITLGPEEIKIPSTEALSIQYEYDEFMFETDEATYQKDLMFWTDDQGNGMIFVSIPDESSIGDVDGDEDEDQSESVSVDEYDNEIPSGYPFDAAPLYKGDYKVIIGEVFEVGGGLTYHVLLGTNDQPEKVVDDALSEIIEIADEVVFDLEENGTRMTMVNADNWTATVTVGPSDDSNFETFIQYTVSEIIE